jgi:hypothetical protein
LQQHILKDDDGLLLKDEKNVSYWGLMALSGDDYANGEGRDLMNEGSSSRLYSFNIYVYFDVIYYHRYYKKLLSIIAEGLPIVTGFFSFFEFIAKIFKISSENEKLIELLFEKGKSHDSKPIKIENKFNILETKQNNNFLDNNCISLKDIIYINSPKKENKRNFPKIIHKTNNIYLSSTKLISPFENEHNEKSNEKAIESNRESKPMKKININEEPKIYIYTDINAYNNNIMASSNKKKEQKSLFNPYKGLHKNNYTVRDKTINKFANKSVDDNQCKNKKMFPAKYYLCTVFVTNPNQNCSFFSEKFIEVYQFVCQLIDFSSYITLQKEFEILKNTLMIDKEIIENSRKINVNEESFKDEMKECLQTKKLTILGKIRNKE